MPWFPTPPLFRFSSDISRARNSHVPFSSSVSSRSIKEGISLSWTSPPTMLIMHAFTILGFCNIRRCPAFGTKNTFTSGMGAYEDVDDDWEWDEESKTGNGKRNPRWETSTQVARTRQMSRAMVLDIILSNCLLEAPGVPRAGKDIRLSHSISLEWTMDLVCVWRLYNPIRLVPVIVGLLTGSRLLLKLFPLL